MKARPIVNFLDWVPSDVTQISEPSPERKSNGYDPLNPLPAKHFNWLMHSLDQWLQYVESSIAFPTTRVGSFADVSNGRADYDSLAAALGSGAKRILILEGTHTVGTIDINDSFGVVIEGERRDSTILNGSITISGRNTIIREVKVHGSITISGRQNVLDIARTNVFTFSDTSGDTSNYYRISSQFAESMMSGGQQGTISVASNTSQTLNDMHNGMTLLCNTIFSPLGNIVINLPPPRKGFTVTIKDAGGYSDVNNIVINRNGSEQLEGVLASFIIDGPYTVKKLKADGTNWHFC